MDSCENDNPIPVSVKIEKVLLAEGATASRNDFWFTELAGSVSNTRYLIYRICLEFQYYEDQTDTFEI